ncbi:MAG: hypothetical protein IJ433_04100 [Ruminococcus sp.]|nr:hypothetical protein [Ruminococcus sp.]
MINYFYNIILKTDSCDLYSDVLTGIRKDYNLSKEKQKGKITQNSSGDTLFYEFSIEKEKAMKWSISDSKSIISDCKVLNDNQSCVNYYDANGKCKSIVFSKYQTLLKVEYYNMLKTAEPYCVIEPRKAGNGLCLLLTSRESIRPSVLYPMPDVQDDYILDKLDLEFDDYTVVASTNEGVVKFLSESQLESFENFVDRATAMKLTDTAPQSFIEEDDAVLAQKLNPKDFNIKRNLSEIIDISKAQEFSYDNIEEELVSDLVIDELDLDDNTDVADNASLDQTAEVNAVEPVDDIAVFEEEIVEADVSYKQVDDVVVSEDAVECLAEETTENIVSEEVCAIEDVVIDDAVDVADDSSDEDEVQLEIDTVEDMQDTTLEADADLEETDDSFEVGETATPDRVIESSSAKYLYFGGLDDDGNRSGFGRTSTEDGKTAYEGSYSNNKRNGVGAYYYKDSSLCYYGDWKDNKREGFGIGVSSFDKSVHVGKFADNKPFGDGVRVNSDGNIKFVKKVLSNGVSVELSFDGDKIIVSKYDENGELISENTSNLMYF